MVKPRSEKLCNLPWPGGDGKAGIWTQGLPALETKLFSFLLMMFLSWNSISEAKLLFTFEVWTFHEAINPDCPWRSTHIHRSDGSHAHLSASCLATLFPLKCLPVYKLGKRVPHGFILSPCLFKLYAEYIMQKDGLDDSQVGIKIARSNEQTTTWSSWLHEFHKYSVEWEKLSKIIYKFAWFYLYDIQTQTMNLLSYNSRWLLTLERS